MNVKELQAWLNKKIVENKINLKPLATDGIGRTCY